MDESSTDAAECRMKVASGRIIRSLANTRGFQRECTGVLHETLFMTVLVYVSEKMT